MNDHDTGDVNATEAGLSQTRRDFLKSAAAAGLASTAIVGMASILPMRVFAQDGIPAGTVTYGNAEPPTSNYWDPAAGFGLVDEQVASLVHDTLIAFDETGALLPSLATAWTLEGDTKVKLTLRTDAKFHDGAAVTAEDVKASIDRLGEGKLAQSMVATPGISVTIVSPTEIEVVSPTAFGVVLNMLAFVKILPKKNIDAPDAFKVGALGSGPYKFVSYAGNDVTLEANADYWAVLPRSDGHLPVHRRRPGPHQRAALQPGGRPHPRLVGRPEPHRGQCRLLHRQGVAAGPDHRHLPA